MPSYNLTRNLVKVYHLNPFTTYKRVQSLYQLMLDNALDWNLYYYILI